jgi:hypothetical protein
MASILVFIMTTLLLGSNGIENGEESEWPTLALHVTLCPVGSTTPYDEQCSHTPAAGFLIQANPTGPFVPTDSNGNLNLDLVSTFPGRVVIAVDAPKGDLGPYDLAGFCGPNEAVVDIARANPGGADLALIFSMKERADVACWIAMIPLTSLSEAPWIHEMASPAASPSSGD